MKYSLRIALLLTFFGIAQSQIHAGDFNKEAALNEAKEITQAFAGNLKKELQSAMKAGGPENALGVCNVEAMPITAKSMMDSGALVSRVSLKNRNPGNVPNEWQKAILKEFDRRAADGEDVMQMASANVVEVEGGKRQMRFMKALPTGDVCLACHGQGINDGVQAKLDTLYPNDKATGYSKGEVRGAIVVIKDYD